jgi:hypothetical protein
VHSRKNLTESFCIEKNDFSPRGKSIQENIDYQCGQTKAGRVHPAGTLEVKIAVIARRFAEAIF